MTPSPVPPTIPRGTSFMVLVIGFAAVPPVGNPLRLPQARTQPTAAEELASAAGRVATGTPLNRITEVGGPEPLSFEDLIRQALSVQNDPRQIVADPDAEYFGTKLSDDSLLPGEGALLGEIRFADWLGAFASVR